MDNKEHQKLLKKTYFTVLYLNLLNFTPTSFEVWRSFLDIRQESGKVSFFDISFALSELKKRGKLLNKNSFWSTDKKVVSSRTILQKKSLRKIRKIKKWIKLIKHLPFIRGVFVSGTLAFEVSSESSDWDILVVLKKDRIWLGRLVLTLFLFIVGKKRRNLKIKNRFCLNHFLTENNLIPNRRTEYIALELEFMFPVLGTKNFNDFGYLNWNWCRKFLPNFEFIKNQENILASNDKESSKLRDFLEIVLEFGGLAKKTNSFCKKWMKKRIKNNPMTFEKGSVVIYEDGELAFWPSCENKNVLKKDCFKSPLLDNYTISN